MSLLHGLWRALTAQTVEVSRRVEVVTPREVRRLERRARQNVERLLKAGARPKGRDEWCTHELEALRDRLQPEASATVTRLRTAKSA